MNVVRECVCVRACVYLSDCLPTYLIVLVYVVHTQIPSNLVLAVGAVAVVVVVRVICLWLALFLPFNRALETLQLVAPLIIYLLLFYYFIYFFSFIVVVFVSHRCSSHTNQIFCFIFINWNHQNRKKKNEGTKKSQQER